MRKRIAYVGISYPLLYDYKHGADKTLNDITSSPNPIIESPLGLMIFYDEIWFLCRSICPNNMRNLPYVKIVDELYPDFWFEGILTLADEEEKSIIINNEFTYNDIKKALNVKGGGIDTHTHGLKIGDIIISASSNENHFLFDLYVFQALHEQYNQDIELITNSIFVSEKLCGGAKSEFIDRIIIPGIPNYIGIDGPYHACMEELRENKYIKDFRRWIIEEHSNIQRAEIKDMCVSVEKNMEDVKQKIFKKYLDDNSAYSFFQSTGSATLKAVAGTVCSIISFLDVFQGSVDKGKNYCDAKNVRWQGFIMDARNIVKKI